MRTVAVALAACAAFAASPSPAIAQVAAVPAVQAPEPARLALGQQIVDRGFPVDKRERLFFAAMDQILIQMRKSTLRAYDLQDEGAIALLDEWTAEYVADSKEVLRSHIPSLMDGLAASYANVFTRRELEDILAFVSTPSGQRFFELSSGVMAEPHFAAANQAYMNEVQAQLPGAMEDLFARIESYLAEQDAAQSQVES